MRVKNTQGFPIVNSSAFQRFPNFGIFVPFLRFYDCAHNFLFFYANKILFIVQPTMTAPLDPPLLNAFVISVHTIINTTFMQPLCAGTWISIASNKIKQLWKHAHRHGKSFVHKHSINDQH